MSRIDSKHPGHGSFPPDDAEGYRVHEETSLRVRPGPGPLLGRLEVVDSSVQSALAKANADAALAAEAHGKIDKNVVLDLLMAAADRGQINKREWDMIKDWAAKNWNALPPDAKARILELDAAIGDRDERATGPNDPVLNGRELIHLAIAWKEEREGPPRLYERGQAPRTAMLDGVD